MKQGINRFNYYTDQLKDLFETAKQAENPALWMLKNNVRTPFFMLQALARLYRELHNPELFSKLKDQFKLIEDGLGQIDHYNTLYLEFENNTNVPDAYKEAIKKQLVKSTSRLNETLKEEDWLSEKNLRIEKINKKLEKADWLEPEDEVKAIADFYLKSIVDVTDFVSKTKYHFDDVEHDVHEMRRKLRWLSIYAQALHGVVQFSDKEIMEPHLTKYLTEAIINSPFNQLPAPGSNTVFVKVNKNYFLALSWIIAELGNIKDEGLLLTGLSKTIKEVEKCSDSEALQKAYEFLGSKQLSMETILDKAETITQIFFIEKNLDHLLARTDN
jgi:hypothetical protein